MRKIIAALLVLAVAAPALATNVSVTQISGTEVQISYDASGDPCLVRAFGIDVVLDTDVNFVDVNDTSTDYWVFPGTMYFSGGSISNYGTPIGEVSDNSDTQPGLDSNGVTLEMASLYASGDPAPGTTGDLVVLEMENSSGMSSLIMSDNTARGGIVLEDGSPGSSYGSTTVYHSTLNRDQYIMWVSWGDGNPGAAPANWRGWCWQCGDVDVDGFVTFADVIATFDYFKDGTSTGEGDSDMDGFETFADVIKTFDDFKNIGSCAPCQ